MKKSLKFCKSKTGFTLVELVIVIAIVIILSAISVPIYRGYIDKSKMSEGYALLGAILSAQRAYYSEHGTFLRYQESGGNTSYNSILGVDARSNKYFTVFQPGGESEDPKIACFALAWKPLELREQTPYLILCFHATRGATYRETLPGSNWWK